MAEERRERTNGGNVDFSPRSSSGIHSGAPAKQMRSTWVKQRGFRAAVGVDFRKHDAGLSLGDGNMRSTE